MPEEGGKSPGRKLISKPALLQDWDTEVEEQSSKYWELFADLILVGTSAAIADRLKDNQSPRGIEEFVVLYMLVVNGYFLYSPHYTTRFEEGGSLLHSLLLFPFLLGLAICTVNASFATATFFALGAIMQRFIVIIMLAVVYVHIERARAFCSVLCGFAATGIVPLILCMIFKGFQVKLLWITMALETLQGFVLPIILRKEALVPINIEHTQDRMNCLALVMLGETIVSATITYRRLAASETTVVDVSRYYWTLGLSFLLIFMFSLLYFHMQPAAHFSGYRISRIRGILLLFFQKLLGMALLAVGVGVRILVLAVVEGSRLTFFGSALMAISVGSCLSFLLAIRLLHFGFVRDIRKLNFPPRIYRIMDVWWITFAIACVLPFLLILADISDPVTSAATYSGLIFFLTLTESGFTHTLEPYIARRIDYSSKTANQGKSKIDEETDLLLQGGDASTTSAPGPGYQSVQ
mmetsp:Transcript_25606/g.59470  ORF Transcript_25606/g.59470 Transcript_25606/m.59470 type:complete len:466 (-) Transcript_25606:482-1879(-)